MNTLSKSLILAGAATLLPILSHATTFWGVSTNNELVSFNDSNPAVITESHSITGLKVYGGTDDDPNAWMLNLARSAFNGALYGIDNNANFYQLATNGVASYVASLSPYGYDAGFDYDGFFNSFRYITNLAENVDVAPDGSELAFADAHYGVGDTYEAESFESVGLGIDGFTGEVFSIDASLDTLSQSFDPSIEEFFTIGDLGIDVTGLASLTVNSYTGTVYAALSENAYSSSLYKVNTATGAASLIGAIGDNGFGEGIGISAITVRSVPSSLNTAYALIAGMFALVVVRRRISHS